MQMNKVLTFVGGIAAIVAVYFLAKATATNHGAGAGPPQYELPHATIVVSGFDLSRKADRDDIFNLETNIEKNSGFSFSGLTRSYSAPWGDPSQGPTKGSKGSTEPMRFLLPPSADAQGRPIAKEFSELTDEEWTKASAFFRTGAWISPRILAPDQKSYVIRLEWGDRLHPASGVGDRLQNSLGTFGHGLIKTTIYSDAYGIGGATERNATNAIFGVSTTWVRLATKPGSETDLSKLGELTKLSGARDKLLEQEKTLRSSTTPLSWGMYYTGVMKGVAEPTLNLSEPQWAAALEFARREKVNCFVNEKGTVAIIEATTTAEGEENERLTARLAMPLGAMFVNTRTEFYMRKPR